MITAIATAKYLEKNDEIILIEKNNSLGKKLLLTGNGRCNIANSKPIKDQLSIFNNKAKNFLKHSFHTLNNEDLLAIFKEKKLKFREEENGRYFPITDDANSILEILKNYLDELNVEILLNNSVNLIQKDENDLFEIKTNKLTISSEKIIIATGGITYPKTGSSGDGYKIATTFNHSIITPKPGLIPLKIENNYLKQLSGLTLEDVEISYNGNISENENKSKKKMKNIKIRGNILITHFGLSGPAILNLSNYIIENMDNNNQTFENKNNFQNQIDFNDLFISIDLTPSLSQEELNKRIIEDSQKNGKTMIKNYMKYYLKNRFIDYFLNSSNLSGNKTLSNMKKKDKTRIINNLKDFNIKIKSLMPEEVAMITCGGVKISEINSKTMESKLVNGLYFAGELLEPCGPTGGYNLQIAFSTGYLAGKSVADSINIKNDK